MIDPKFRLVLSLCICLVAIGRFFCYVGHGALLASNKDTNAGSGSSGATTPPHNHNLSRVSRLLGGGGGVASAIARGHSDDAGSRQRRRRQLLEEENDPPPAPRNDGEGRRGERVLYIVTSIAEYDTGRRETIAGNDRFSNTLLPVLKDGVESMVAAGYRVDVYLIANYTVTESRRQQLEAILPESVGLQIWDEAAPIGYEIENSIERVSIHTRGLARQHRYVIKDKLPHYDLFVSFEDDMRITGAHVRHYLDTSAALDALRTGAAEASSTALNQQSTLPSSTFFGPVSERQLDRLVPGFVRVEVLLDLAANGAQRVLDPVPLDYVVDRTEYHFDPAPCCHINIRPNKDNLPVKPNSSDVVVWETAVKALYVRKLPSSSSSSTFLDWVALLPGPGKRMQPADKVTGYWSGEVVDGWSDAQRPSPGEPTLIAQQGGWMATRRQILRWDDAAADRQLCQGTFLPPFDEPVYRKDGQESMNVELYVPF
jgi:hypothetical protein